MKMQHSVPQSSILSLFLFQSLCEWYYDDTISPELIMHIDDTINFLLELPMSAYNWLQIPTS